MKHKHILIIGRPSDGENDCLTLTGKTEKQAIDTFKKMLREEYDFKAGERNIYLEAVIASESPISVLQYHQ